MWALKYLEIIFGSFISVYLGIKFFIPYLQKLKIFDIPNHRSNHIMPTPRGGGLIIILSIFLFSSIFIILNNLHSNILIISSLALLLSAIFFIDDIKGLSVLFKLLVQVIVAIFGVNFLPKGLIFGGMFDFVFDRCFAVIFLVGFMNCYNFMDGIDGITICQTLYMVISLLIFTLLLNITNYNLLILMFSIIGASFGFLLWNWSPAKIFMGDSGSIPLGFLIGWLLLYVGSFGFFPIIVILPIYYFFDTSVTIFSRVIRRQSIWKAHSEHFYQQAVRRGLSHLKVVKIILLFNFVFFIFAFLSLKFSLLSICISTIFVIIQLILLSKKSLLPTTIK